MRKTTAAFLLSALALAVVAPAGQAVPRSREVPEFLGEVTFPTGTMLEGTEVGGLSGVTYDATRDQYYVIADDRSEIDPARFYTVAVDVSDGSLDPGDIAFIDVTFLRDAGGDLFPPLALDPEGIALTKNDTLVITSEGDAQRGIDPWVREFELDGDQVADLPVPDYYDPAPGVGVRNNLAFESATVSNNGRFVFTGTENALAQDGPAATLTDSSPSRILQYHLVTGTLAREYVYPVEPIPEPPVPAGAFAVNGLVELLALNNSHLLAMERAFAVGAGNTVRLYEVSTAGATDVEGNPSLAGGLEDVRPVDKELLLDLDTLGITLDNLEGMTLGPRLPDGRRLLLLVSDNNFSSGQFTQFLAFAI